MRKIVFAFIVLFSFLGGMAQAQVMVEEAKVRLNVNPGETVMDSLLIHNTTEKPLNIKVYWEDFTYVPPYTKGDKDLFPAGNGKYSCASWINFLPRELTLPAYGKKAIEYTIKVPTNAKGGYYGVMFFEHSGVQATGNVGVNIVTRVGSLFFLETKDKDKSCQVSGWKASDKGFEAKFMNKGNAFLLPQGTYYVMDSQGMVADRGEIPRAYLPPGEGVDFSVPYPKGLKMGDYFLVVTLDLEDDVSKAAEVDFSLGVEGKFQIKAVRD